MKKNYTQGPWRIMKSGSTVNPMVRDDGGIVAEVYHGGESNGNRGKGETDATAQLISAAPDLVDALDSLMSALSENEWPLSGAVEVAYSSSRAALIKAGVIEKK